MLWPRRLWVALGEGSATFTVVGVAGTSEAGGQAGHDSLTWSDQAFPIPTYIQYRSHPPAPSQPLVPYYYFFFKNTNINIKKYI